MAYQDPLQLFTDALTAVRSEDWLGLARLCDPSSLVYFQRQQLRSLEPRTLPTVNADEYLKRSPDLPREVAEYYAAQASQPLDANARIRDEYPTVASLSDLLALTPLELFAAWLRGRSPRVQLQVQVKDGRLPPRAVHRIQESFNEALPEPVVLGVLRDGDNFAHVVYRSAEPDPTVLPEMSEADRYEREVVQKRHVQVEPMRRSDDGAWHLIAGYHFLGLGHNVFFVYAEEADEV